MSLYADEDLGAPESLVATSSASAIPTDPVQALSAALILPADTPAQADALTTAAQSFERHPEKLPELCSQLLPMVVDGEGSLLRSWTLDMVALAVGRSTLGVEIKLGVAQASLEALNRLLAESEVRTLERVIPIFSTIHPVLFRLLSSPRPSPKLLDLFQSSKARIISLVLDPNATPQNVGVKAAAWKFVQRVLLAGTRAASADPRLQNKGGGDPNIGIIAPGSPLNPGDLEAEANLLRTQLVTQLYTSSEPAILNPILNIIPLLSKSRPTLAALFIASLASWTPGMLEQSKQAPMQIRAVEKTARMVMGHLVKYPPLSAFAAQLNDALIRQKHRMETAFVVEQEERRTRRARAAVPSVRQAVEVESSADGLKRVKREVSMSSDGARPSHVDVTALPLEAVVEIVMAGLQAISADQLNRSFSNAHRALAEKSSDAVPLLASSIGFATAAANEQTESKVEMDEDDDLLNPLDMDADDDEELLLHEPVDDLMDEAVTITEFSLPPAEPLDAVEREATVNMAIERIWDGGKELAGLPDPEETDRVKLAVQPKELWMLLTARLATRGSEMKRKAIVDFVVADFAARSKFASVWLNEEWFHGQVDSTGQYNATLGAVLSAYLPQLDSKDRLLSGFLIALPELPAFVITQLETLCEDPERSIPGFLALRDLIETRPPVREQALNVLLQLCTHSDRKTRVSAISTVRRWVPDSPMASTVVNYGLAVLRRLVKSDAQPDDIEMEDGEQIEETVESKYLSEVRPETLQQHVELVFALSRRQQDLLDDIFRLYAKMEAHIQDPVEKLLEPLIQSLGTSPKLLEVIRNFPPGSERLALAVVQVLGTAGSTGTLVTLVKGLMSERELDPRFIIPIIGELDKAEIEIQIPRIVPLLGSADTRDLVRSAFASILQKMTPADLFLILHKEEGGLKPTIEAIGICFSMTSVFRSDVLASAMSRIADLPTLPVVFLRTVIQAVSTYKSLIQFIANNVLPKLVAKRIWEMPQLWDGFARLAKMIAPASYGVLLQLPKDCLRDVVDKHPGLKTGLKGFLAGKPQARGALVEIFGED